MNPMRQATTSLVTAIAAALLIVGCREGTEDVFRTDGGPFFDASVPHDAAVDDAGPGRLCPDGAQELFVNEFSPYRGGEESVDLEIVDFSYFGCHSCANFAAFSEALFENRPDIRARVRLYFHHFPRIYETDAEATEKAWGLHAASHAAGKQGMEYFWALHDYIFDAINNEGVYYSVAALRTYCQDVLQLDMVQFDEDFADPYTTAFLEWDREQGNAAGVGDTPSVFVCGEEIDWGELEEIVDGYLGR